MATMIKPSKSKEVTFDNQIDSFAPSQANQQRG
jgi:hypothetical protein